MKISTHNHWDKLREIVVGSADNYRIPTVDRSTMSFSYTTDSFEDVKHLQGPLPQSLIDEANEDAQGLVNVLEQAGVVVHRPNSLDHSFEYSTPEWKTTGWSTWCPRDLLLPLDNLMIETPSPCRSRYFETRAYTDIMFSAIRDGSEWIAAPKPVLKDEIYQFEELEKPSLLNHEPVFDAPNCVRLGNDILFQVSNSGNHFGLQWLKTVLEPRGYRIHPAEHIYSYGHFDSTIVPLRPGLVLLNSTRVTPDNCPKLFEKWDKIWFDDCIAQTAAIPGGIAPCSTYIGMNILSIDPDTVVIDEAQLPLIKTLEAYGITCIPIQFRHAMTLSGGLHCLTLDLIREGERETYV